MEKERVCSYFIVREAGSEVGRGKSTWRVAELAATCIHGAVLLMCTWVKAVPFEIEQLGHV